MTPEELREFSALAERFHQDFDLEGRTFLEELQAHALRLPGDRRLTLLRALRTSLAQFPTNRAYIDALVNAAAENLMSDTPRDEVSKYLSAQGG